MIAALLGPHLGCAGVRSIPKIDAIYCISLRRP
jgi:hypothetical protein